MSTIQKLQTIFSKTSGHCHFCGDPLVFGRRGMKNGKAKPGAWEVDHIIQRAKGGCKGTDNCLPACARCNRLRWHRTGAAMRKILYLGIIAKDEIKKGTDTGAFLSARLRQRKAVNKKRRKSVDKRGARQKE